MILVFFKAFKWGKQETECVPLTISYYLHFPRICKAWSMFHHGSLGWVLSKEYYFVFTYNFLTFFFCFSSKIFFDFYSFFWQSIKFPQQNINQSETGIGDMKLSLAMYDHINLSRVNTFIQRKFSQLWIDTN